MLLHQCQSPSCLEGQSPATMTAQNVSQVDPAEVCNELLQGGHCASEIAALQLYTALTTKNSRHWRGTPLSYLRQRIQMAKDDVRFGGRAFLE